MGNSDPGARGAEEAEAERRGTPMRAPLTSLQLRLLGLMAKAARATPEEFAARLARAFHGVTGYADLGQDNFATVADGFVGLGFRHPALPILSKAQRVCLLRAARRLGLPGPATRAMFRESTGSASTRGMTGWHFLGLMAAFEALGAAEPLPAPGFMDRQRAMKLRRKAWVAGVEEEHLRAMMARLGGTMATRGLDERAWTRIMMALGPLTPDPAPPVDGEAGMVTQAQANLVWRLWLDARRGQDASWGKLDVAIRLSLGLPGGVDTLTRAGARALIDRLQACRTEFVDLRSTRPIEPGGEARGPLQ